MNLPFVASSGIEPIGTEDHEWVTVLEVGASQTIDYITLHNDGEAPGFWRLVDLFLEAQATDPARLEAGPSITTIPCPGLKGAKLQVKRDLLDGHLKGVYAWGMKTG